VKSLVFGLMCCVMSVTAQERIPLWKDQAPVGDGKFEAANAFITVHRPAQANGTALIICPGGGYGGLVAGPEGHGIAKWLNQHGITGIVLEYRLPRGRAAVPLLDAQQAIRLTRQNAKEWGIDPQRIGIIGFSAGGHLAATTATHFEPDCRPDFAVLIYPVITMGAKTHGGSKNNLLGPNPTPALVELYSNEKQVTAQTAPTFLAHAKDDTLVPADNSRMFYEALLAHKVPAQYLELPSGGHGLNGYKGPMWDAWQTQVLQWLATPPPGLRTWSLAHSFHSFVPPLLQEMAQAAGIKGHDFGISAIGGARVMTHWDASVRADQVRAYLEAGKADVLTLSLIWLPDEGIEKFAKLGFEHNPNLRITLQENWLPQDRYETKDRSLKVDHNTTDLIKLRQEQAAYAKDLDDETQRISKLLGKPVMFAVPVGQAVLALREQIAAGKCPGIQTQAELFTDSWGHCTTPIQVLNAYCHFAVVYRISPVGLPMPAIMVKEKRDEKLNRLLQELAWDAVTHHPLSGVK